MPAPSPITVRPFAASDQPAARALILAGFGEHFGVIDETLNPDLNDIAASYADATFLVAERDGAIVGTGALTREPDGARRVQRMSVAKQHRRRGIARCLLTGLVDHAAGDDGCDRVVLTTHADWQDAIAFYLASGFTVVARPPGGVDFARDISRR